MTMTKKPKPYWDKSWLEYFLLYSGLLSLIYITTCR